MKQKKTYEDMIMLLTKYNDAYRKGEPLISDHDYDMMEMEIKELEKTIPKKHHKKGPHNQIDDGLGKGKELSHLSPMRSLEDVFTVNECAVAMTKLGDSDMIGQHKFDGVSLNLVYKDGVIFRAISRGDGLIGIDMSKKVMLALPNIPHHVNMDGMIEVRGEVVVPLDTFNKVSDKYSNPRNYASGSLFLNDPLELKERGLKFIAYALIDDKPHKTEVEKMDLLKENGFDVPTSVKVDRSSIVDFHDDVVALRSELPYAIDGIVIKANKISQQKELGVNNKYPKYALALKFPPETQQTIVTDIEYQLSYTGKITPVAIVKPILLNFTVVSRVTLHNVGLMLKDKITVGCKVDIIKSGDIIPKIVKVYPNPNTTAKLPEVCPACGEPLVLDDVNLSCVNIECTGKELYRYIRFASKNHMNMTGISESIIKKIYESGNLNSFEDFYKLTEDNLMMFKPKTRKNILNAIEMSRHTTEHKVLAAIGIKGIGNTTAKLILDNKAFTKEKLINVKGISNITANNYMEWRQKHADEYKSLLSCLILDTKKRRVVGITGRFEIPREEIKKRLKDKGMDLGSFNKSMDFVMIGEKPSKSKLKRIEGLNIPRLELS